MAKWEFLAAGGANAHNQNGRTIGVAYDVAVDRIIARQLPRLVAMRTGGCTVPDAHTACGAGLNKKGVAIGADFGPGSKLEITARAREDEAELAIGAIFVLVIDARTAARTRQLSTL